MFKHLVCKTSYKYQFNQKKAVKVLSLQKFNNNE